MKNWVGDKNSIYKTLGASSHCKDDREENDYYATDPEAVKELLKVETFNRYIVEPCVGQGHIAKELWLNHIVIGLDLVDRGFYNTIQSNFLTNDLEGLEGNYDIITNPPYKYALEFAEHSLKLINNGNKVAMLLKLTFLEGQKRKKFFKQNPPKYVYVFSKRMACAKNGKFIVNNKRVSSAVAYAWFIWEKGYKGETIVRWI